MNQLEGLPPELQARLDQLIEARGMEMKNHPETIRKVFNALERGDMREANTLSISMFTAMDPELGAELAAWCDSTPMPVFSREDLLAKGEAVLRDGFDDETATGLLEHMVRPMSATSREKMADIVRTKGAELVFALMTDNVPAYIPLHARGMTIALAKWAERDSAKAAATVLAALTVQSPAA